MATRLYGARVHWRNDRELHVGCAAGNSGKAEVAGIVIRYQQDAK